MEQEYSGLNHIVCKNYHEINHEEVWAYDIWWCTHHNCHRLHTVGRKYGGCKNRIRWWQTERTRHPSLRLGLPWSLQHLSFPWPWEIGSVWHLPSIRLLLVSLSPPKRLTSLLSQSDAQYSCAQPTVKSDVLLDTFTTCLRSPTFGDGGPNWSTVWIVDLVKGCSIVAPFPLSMYLTMDPMIQRSNSSGHIHGGSAFEVPFLRLEHVCLSNGKRDSEVRLTLAMRLVHTKYWLTKQMLQSIVVYKVCSELEVPCCYRLLQTTKNPLDILF